MAILVKHSGNVAQGAVGAYGAGQGKRQAQETTQARSLAARQKESNQRRKSLMDAAEIRRKTSLETAHISNQGALERDELNRTAKADAATLSHGRDMQQSMLDARVKDRLGQREAQRERDNFRWEYTEGQKNRYNEINQIWRDAVQDGNYTDEELEVLKDKLMSEQAGIEPTKTMITKSKYPEGQNVGEVWTEGNSRMTRDKDGIPKEVGTIGLSPKEKATMYKKALESSRAGDAKEVNITKAGEIYKAMLLAIEGEQQAPAPELGSEEGVEEPAQQQQQGGRFIAPEAPRIRMPGPDDEPLSEAEIEQAGVDSAKYEAKKARAEWYRHYGVDTNKSLKGSDEPEYTRVNKKEKNVGKFNEKARSEGRALVKKGIEDNKGRRGSLSKVKSLSKSMADNIAIMNNPKNQAEKVRAYKEFQDQFNRLKRGIM